MAHLLSFIERLNNCVFQICYFNAVIVFVKVFFIIVLRILLDILLFIILFIVLIINFSILD